MHRHTIAIILAFAALVSATALLLSSPSPTTGSSHAKAPDKAAQKEVHGVETTKIVPADILGTGAVIWAPLTGDGSN